MGLRLGLEGPSGPATGAAGDTMSARHSVLAGSMGLDPGWKVTDAVFVGGYVTMIPTGSGENPRIERACEDSDSDGKDDVLCDAATYRFGAQGQYHFRPAETVNPWLGLGAGYEIETQSVDAYSPRRTESTTSRGWELTLTGAVDFRFGRVFGLGLWCSTQFGWYVSSTTTINGRTTFDGSIPDTAMHRWTGGGLRMVLFP